MYNNIKDCKKYVSKPSFVSQKIFSKTFVAIPEIKPVLTFDKPVYVGFTYKPVYVGFSILDLSKLLMYKFLYKYIGTKYDNSAKLLFADRIDTV